MVKDTLKNPPKVKKNRGRQSDFSGKKEAYLDGLTDEFQKRKDRSTFYDEAAQGFIEKFGYSRDGKVFVKADKLTSDERSECYKGLRTVSVHLFGEVLVGLLARCLETRPMVQTSLLSEVL